MKTIYLAILFLIATTSCLLAQATLRSGDTVDIRLSGVNVPDEIQQFSSQYTIDDKGDLNLPYIHNVKASGLRPAQLQAAIQHKLVADKIYTHPTITVLQSNSTASARFVNVGGEVKQPTRIPYTADLTVLTSITAAGSFTEYADQKHIRWTHNNKVHILDARKLRKDPKLDPKVSPGDKIDVPASIW